MTLLSSAEAWMDSGLAERVAHLEARMQSLVTHSELTELREQTRALCTATNKFMDAKIHSNAVIEKRLDEIEKTLARMDLKWTIAGGIASAALLGVIGLIFRMIEKLAGGS